MSFYSIGTLRVIWLNIL